MPDLDAFSHISLTVTDPERSADVYKRVLGTEAGSVWITSRSSCRRELSWRLGAPA
jgi:hypothetical protein